MIAWGKGKERGLLLSEQALGSYPQLTAQKLSTTNNKIRLYIGTSLCLIGILFEPQVTQRVPV
ncbi:hypothetical protein GCM10027180_24640 [Microbulbifer echini]